MPGRPTYLAAPGGAERERFAAGVPGAVVLDPALVPGALAEAEPGVLLLHPDAVPTAGLLDLARALSPARGWTICLLTEGPGGAPEARTLSLGSAHPLEEVAGAADGAAPGGLLELHGVLAEVARVRHDLNNPLTSAMAEVQILLMDTQGGAEEESLRIVQEQLRRMRDRLLATRHIRPAEP